MQFLGGPGTEAPYAAQLEQAPPRAALALTLARPTAGAQDQNPPSLQPSRLHCIFSPISSPQLSHPDWEPLVLTPSQALTQLGCKSWGLASKYS